MEDVKWLGCTAHTLQLVVGKGMKLAEILITRVKRLIDFFLRPKQSERLEDVQVKFPELANNQNNLDDNEEIVSILFYYNYNLFFIFKNYIKICIYIESWKNI
jgi:hypothetical protein